MHEDLLGYLLGALDEAEMLRVGNLVRDNPSLREELESLKTTLDLVEATYVPVEPPPIDLVKRTLDLVDETKSTEGGFKNREINSAGRSPVRASETHATEVEEVSKLGQLSSELQVNQTSSFGWFDWVGGAIVAAVILGILIPALANGRLEARKIACQDQLRILGVALTDFVNRSPEKRLPAVAESGPQAFAGVYAVHLNEAGLLPNPNVRWCPSLTPPDTNEVTLTNLGEIASLPALHDASVDQLSQIQYYSGGHYAYNLGVLEQEHFTSPRFEARSSFAIMSDAPLVGRLNMEDLNQGNRLADWVGHGGEGINVLYEDGGVRFIPVDALRGMPDNPLLNHRGQAEAGVNIDDASLAPSWKPPFIDVSQR